MSAAFVVGDWTDFFVMLGGAAAVLAGLQLVVLILRVEVAGTAWLRTGPRAYFVFLGAVLVLAALALIPDQPRSVVGAEITAVAIALLVVYAVEMQEIVAAAGGVIPARLRRWAPTRLAAILALLWGGISVIAAHAGGLYVAGPAMISLVAINLQGVWWALIGHQPHTVQTHPGAAVSE